MSQGYCMSNCNTHSTSNFSPVRDSSNLEYIANSSVDTTSSNIQPNQVYESAISLSSLKQNYNESIVTSPVTNSLTNSQTNSSTSNLLTYSRYNHNDKNNFYSSSTNLSNSYNIVPIRENYHFIPDDFLKPGLGDQGFFVGKAEEIESYVKETFEKMFNRPFPADIKVSVLDKERFRKLAPNPATVGLCINRKRQGLISEIFVFNNSLARVMLTLGHELGHALTKTLPNQHDEEAKAFAFSLAWMKIIKDNDIAGLGNAIILDQPAENGLHNVAFNYVQKLINAGRKAWDVYLKFVKKEFSVIAS